MSVIYGRTPRLKLNLPNFDVSGWEPYLRDNFYIIDAAVAEFIANNQIMGVWKNSTKYLVDDVLVDAVDGSLWRANTEHTSATSGTFDADRKLTFFWSRFNPSLGASEGLAVTPDQFGSDPEFPDQDTTAAVQTALTEAIARGVPLQLDRMFNVSASLDGSLDDFDTLRIRGNGGILCTANLLGKPILSVTAEAAEIIAVTVVDNTASYDFGGQGNLTLCAKITAPGHTIEAGGFCKLISNDPVVAGSSTNKGEVVYIVKVVGNDLYTSARLRDTYTSGPRLAAYKRGKKVYINEVTIANEWDGVVEGNQTSCLLLSGLVAPVVDNVTFRDIALSGARVVGCVSASVNRCNFNRGLNANATLGTTGYGLDDRSSEQTQLSGPKGRDCRHVYTTNVSATDPSDPWTYGITRDAVVSNGIGASCSSTPWDTHDHSEKITFVGCKSFGVYQGQDVANGGFQLRGKSHRVINAEHMGVGVGILFDNDNAGIVLTEADRHIIQGFIYDGDNYALRLDPGSEGPYLFVSASEIYARTSYQYGAIRVDDSKLNLEDATLVSRSDQDNRRLLDFRGEAKVTGEDVVLDFTAGYSSTPATQDSIVLAYEGANNELSLKNCTLLSGLSIWDMVKYTGAGGSTDIKMIAQINADKKPVSADGITSAGTGSDIRRFITVDTGRSGNSAYVEEGLATINLVAEIGMKGCFAPQVTRAFLVTGTGIKINSVRPGEFIGQRLIVMNLPGSSNNLLLEANPANRLSILANINLTPGSGTALVWTGQTWLGYSATISTTPGAGVTDHGALTGLSDDDHPQYFTTGRADTWLNGKRIQVFTDVPVLGPPLTALRSPATGSDLEYRMPGHDDPARDIIKLAPSTHDANTAALPDATASIYAMATAATKVAQRLFSGAGKGVWLELRNHAFALLMDMKQSSADLFEMRWRDTVGAVKGYIGGTYQVFGGDSTDRNGTSQVTIVGNLHVTTITGPNDPGDYTAPYLIGAVRVWDDGTGLRQKRNANPNNASDGVPL